MQDSLYVVLMEATSTLAQARPDLNPGWRVCRPTTSPFRVSVVRFR